MPPHFLPGNRLTLLESGVAFFPALIAAINGARREIHLESYIFENDDTGRSVAAALIAAARRGVAVRLMVDGFGAAAFATALMPALSDAGVHCAVYRPETARLRLRRHRLRRLHRKLALIDGTIAFVGGINIIDDHESGRPGVDTHTLAPRFDYAVRVEGPLLGPIEQAMRRLWELVSWASLKRRLRTARRAPPAPAARGDQEAAFLVRDNIAHRRDIEEAYLAAIADAQTSILIANAYFLPGRRFRRALRDAARRGVAVTILLQGRIEYRLLHYATQALYGQLLRAGIRVFEYRKSFLHAKVAVIDGHWATVGSSNIDPFSLLLAREANVVVRDRAFARQLQASLDDALGTGADELAVDSWRRLPWPVSALRWASYNLIRLAIGFAGFRRQDA